jgi:hypothetical protein
MLERIEAGELDATAAMRHRIEGAIAMLDVVQGRAARFDTESGRPPRDSSSGKGCVI